MNGKFLVGQLVRVKDNAFADSDCAEDHLVRGRTGTIRQRNVGPHAGYYRVDIEDLGLYLLRESELEVLE